MCFCHIWCGVQLDNNGVCRQRRERVLVSPPYGNFCWLRLITNCPIFGRYFSPREALTNLLTLWSCLLYSTFFAILIDFSRRDWMRMRKEVRPRSLCSRFFSINPPFPCSKSLARACRREFIATLRELFNSICSIKLLCTYLKLPLELHIYLLLLGTGWHICLVKTSCWLGFGMSHQYHPAW